ncbi:PBP1A family penicillin-binding protein [Bacillus sp. FJAT-49736]|uniref:PBP1A family penicillin-binding protein n=1 Tax=Bacillus sp. FJAT-49736 TaxID=2833582 RepID=UPI001BCA4614|nr:PBP1A family penicillin-binding protein [Bacillus sp. FJAT-49736]MBS4171865.1 PBP1A family penicillin-binding protein [Bacillus sp. FJAT-49736]
MERLQQFWTAVKRLWKKAHMNQIILLAASLFLLGFLGFFAYFASTVNIGSLKKGLSQSTAIYDKDGDLASKISANRIDGVAIKQVPTNLKNAVVSIEDHRFYEHSGFDVKGMTSAFFKNIAAGGVTAGGSTITQQLTKNALLSPERTYKRKVEELFLAVKIEKYYSKDDILQMYLNQIYFGHGAWGVQNASRKYFGKNVENVDLSEAATLAGIINAPSALDPYRHMDKAIERRNVVLGAMKKYGYITKEQYNKAVNEKLVLKDAGGDSLKGKYPYYVDAVLDEATKRYGLTQDEILTRGYRIYTEMDQNIQSALERVYKNDAVFPAGRGGDLVQSGGILLDPHSGGIRALVGGRGEKVFRGFNRATQLQRQPGSTMKPLAVYTPALEEGYSANSSLKDEQMTFGNYAPKNYNGQYLGEVPMYKAVEDSINLPAVWLLNEIGIDKGMDAVKRFGIPLSKEDRNLGLALGGLRKGVSPLEMAEAFSVFANDGKRYDGHIIKKIVGPTGNIIKERKPKETDVTSKKVADEMTSMLLNVVETGTGRGVNVPGYTIAGKTGSTQTSYSSSGTTDQWFVGYTPNIVGAIWIGYDKSDSTHYLSGLSSQGVVPIFQAVMQNTLKYTKPGKFDVQSVNTIQKNKENQSLMDKAEEFDKKLREGTNKLKDKIEKQKGKWKELEEHLKKKWKEFRGH